MLKCSYCRSLKADVNNRVGEKMQKIQRKHLTSVLVQTLFWAFSVSGLAVANVREPTTLRDYLNWYSANGREFAGVGSAYDKLKKYNEEVLYFIDPAVAKVVLKDRELILRDFGKSHPTLKNMNSTQLDKWIIENFAVISSLHLGAKKIDQINSKVKTVGDKSSVGYRQLSYGRAISLVPQGSKVGETTAIAEVKGIGAVDPKNEFFDTATPEVVKKIATEGLISKENGLVPLSEAIGEYLLQKLVSLVVSHMKQRELNETIPNVLGYYAIIDPGFEINLVRNVATPAGLVLRQGHLRGGSLTDISGNVVTAKSVYLSTSDGGITSIQEKANLEYVMALDRMFTQYGIITGTPRRTYHKPDCGWRFAENIQHTSDRSLIDFGGYRVVRKVPNIPFAYDSRLHQANPVYPGEFIDLEDRQLGAIVYPKSNGDPNKDILTKPQFKFSKRWNIWSSFTMPFTKNQPDLMQLGNLEKFSKKIISFSKARSGEDGVNQNQWSVSYSDPLQCALFGEIYDKLDLTSTEGLEFSQCLSKTRRDGKKILKLMGF